MRYAIDDRADRLVEFKSLKELDEANKDDKEEGGNGKRYRPVSADCARAWVRQGWTHETGLWVDSDGVTRYAKADPEGH